MPSTVAPNRPLSALLLAGALVCALGMGMPGEARADDRCALRCAQRQNTCSATCSRGDKCRQHCSDSAGLCFSQCKKTDDKREVSEQRRSEKNCFGANGQMRKCTAAEAREIREGMEQASKLMCRDKKGEQIACPDQAQQLEDAKKFLPKDCTAAGCEAE